MKALRLLSFCLLLQTQLLAQFPNFTAIDIDGVEHQLYEDYLDQGKIVVINLTATWAPPAWDWHQSGVLEAFHQQYGDIAAVFDLEIDLQTTNEDIMGTGNNTLGDWTSNVSYPIFNPTEPGFIDLFEPLFVPAVVIICPNGEAFADFEAPNITSIDGLGWGDIVDTDYLFQLGLQYCDWNPFDHLIEGEVYRDANLSCIDEDEIKMPNIHLEISNGTYTYHRITDENGYFKSPANTDINYTVTAIAPSNLWDWCEDSEEVYFDGSQDSIAISFGLQSLSDCPVPEVDISSPLLLRCFPNSIYVKACNQGTVDLENGELTVVLDTAFIPLSYSTPPTAINGNVLTFAADLAPLECLEISIEVEVSCDAELGQEHCYSANLTGSNLCNTLIGIASDQECQENVGSYDPNDKRSFPRGDGDEHFVKANTDIEYQIRFQNTGTFMAFKVVVVDTISPLFDLTSLRLGASSHAYTLEITNERTLAFTFDNIMLPDSTTDLEGSQGFLNFYLSQVPDLPDGTVLENEARIFFDFNEPIITNTTFLTIGELTSTNDLDIASLPFRIQPNPANDRINVQIQENDLNRGIWRLYHNSGQLMKQSTFQSNNFGIDVQTFSRGVYFLEVEGLNQQRGLQKVIIQ